MIEGKARLITDANGNRTTIVTHVKGLKAGTKHAGHIHFGDCTRLFPGEIVHDLAPLVANEDGRAVSRTVVDDSLASLQDGQWGGRSRGPREHATTNAGHRRRSGTHQALD